MITFILIRHGESEANRQQIFAGYFDAELQNKGLAQACVTAEYISANYKIDKIYSSDLLRAYKTAKCLADKLDMQVITNSNLREIDGGEWEAVKFDDLYTRYPEQYALWVNHIGHSCCTGGESVKQLGGRIMNALTEIARENDGKTVAIATHATPIRAVQSIIKTGSVDDMENIPWVSNASVTVVEYGPRGWNIVAENIDDHLADLKTSLPANV